MAATEGSVFAKIANLALETSEQMVNVIEDGLTVVLSGGSTAGLTDRTQASSSETADATDEFGGSQFDPKDARDSYHGTYGNDDDDGYGFDPAMADSPLNGIADTVLKDILRGQSQPKTLLQRIQAFRSAITWSEPFICCLLLFQIVMFLLVVWMTRPQRTAAARISFLVVIAVIVRSAEYLNSWASDNWQSFATQNYFDQHGFFMGTMLCGPLLFDSLVMLLLYVKEAGSLLVELKTRELNKKRQRRKETKQHKRQDKTTNTDSAKKRKKKSKQHKKDD